MLVRLSYMHKGAETPVISDSVTSIEAQEDFFVFKSEKLVIIGNTSASFVVDALAFRYDDLVSLTIGETEVVYPSSRDSVIEALAAAGVFTVTFPAAVHFTLTGVTAGEAESVDTGDDLVFQITPASGYKVASVIVTSSTSSWEIFENAGSYTIPDVDESLTVAISTTESFTVTLPAASELFAVNALSSTSVDSGDNFLFLIVPSEGEEVKSVTASGATLTAVNGVYTIADIAAAKTIAVVMKTHYAVTAPVATDPVSFAFALSGSNDVLEGTTINFVVLPVTGKEITSVSINSEVVTGTGGVYSFEVTEDAVITVVTGDAA